jgi:DNA-binding transcriptional MerR regulator
MKEGFDKADIERLFGIKRHIIQEWINFGIIKPSFSRVQGRGHRYYFNVYDIYMIKLIETLVAHGFTRSHVRDKIDLLEKHIKLHKIKENLPGYFGFGVLTSDDSPIRMTKVNVTHFNDYKEADMTFFNDWNSAFIIDFSKIKSKVDSVI